MRRSEGKLLLIFLVTAFLCRGQFCAAEELKKARLPIEVKTTIDKKTVNIGDKIKYMVTISTAKDIEVAVSDLGKDSGNFAIKDFRSEKKALFGQQILTQWYVLDTYVTGTSTIPKALIKYRKKGCQEWSQIEAQEQRVEVKSLIENASSSHVTIDDGIIDIENPVAMPSKKNRILIFFLSIVFLGIITAVLFLLRKKKAQPFVLQIPAHEIAYRQLEELRRKEYIKQGRIKEYYSEISDIIRRYLENRFNLNAPEMTTQEFLGLARDSVQLDSSHKTLLREFLTACDMVKFAKYSPALDEINAVFESAKKFIDQTKEEIHIGM